MIKNANKCATKCASIAREHIFCRMIVLADNYKKTFKITPLDHHVTLKMRSNEKVWKSFERQYLSIKTTYRENIDNVINSSDSSILRLLMSSVITVTLTGNCSQSQFDIHQQNSAVHEQIDTVIGKSCTSTLNNSENFSFQQVFQVVRNLIAEAKVVNSESWNP
jgi:hypothetical protein